MRPWSDRSPTGRSPRCTSTERQHLQRWTGLLLPPELIGAHIGPPTAHTTGRTRALSFRAATALLGHFGVEWDIASATDTDRAALTEIIATYQRLRPMLHSGVVVNADHPDPAATLAGVVAQDRSAALFSYAQLTTSAPEAPDPIRLPGLDPATRYTVTVLEAGGPAQTSERVAPQWISDGSITLTGLLLETVGPSLPILHPEQALLLELTAI